MNHALRALILLAAGMALRDCVLLAGSVLLWSVHLNERVDACPDRAHAWLRCLLGGALLLLAGGLLAAHTAVVFFGWWPGAMNEAPRTATALLLVVVLGGFAWRELSLRHGLAALGALVALAATLPWAAWAPCAFAALVAALTLGDGARHLGPIARQLALPHRDR
jgi:hypothetical protein